MHRQVSTGPPKTASSPSLLNESMSDNNSSTYRKAGSGINQHNSSMSQRERSMSNGVDSSHSHPNPSAKNRRRQKSANRLNKSFDFSRLEDYSNVNNSQQKNRGSYSAVGGSVDMNKSFGGITLRGDNDSVSSEVPPAVAPKPMNPAARYLASRRDENTEQGTGDPMNSNKALGEVVSQKENGLVVKKKQVGGVLDSTKMNGQHQSGQNGINLNRSFGGVDRQQGDDSKDGDQKSDGSKNLNKSFGGFDANGETINTRYQQRLNRKMKRQQQKVSNPDIAQEIIQKEVSASETSTTSIVPSIVGVSSEDVPKTTNPYFLSTEIGREGEGSQENGNHLNKPSEPSHLENYTEFSTQQKSNESYTAYNFDLNQKTISDIPIEILAAIAEDLNFPTQMRLRNVSRGFRNIVDDVRLSIDSIVLIFEKYGNSKSSLDLFIYPPYPGEQVYASKRYEEDDLERALDDLMIILKNRRLRLDSLEWRNDPSSEIDKKFVDMLSTLNYKLEIEWLKTNANGDTLVGILKAIKPGTLKDIFTEHKLELSDIERLAQLEQWKKAEYVCFPTDLSELLRNYHYFLHFKHVEVDVVSITIDDIMSIKKLFLQNNMLNHFDCDTENIPSISDIEAALGPSEFSLEEDHEFFSLFVKGIIRIYSIPGSEDILVHTYFKDAAVFGRTNMEKLNKDYQFQK